MATKLWSTVQKGTYSGATAYTVGDFVTYNGASYTCIANTTGNLPTNATYWALVASKGDTGATGATGATGSTGATGAQGDSINWLGAYSGATAYEPLDSVSYLGSSYICILASTGNLPTNATYWNLMAQKGVDGGGGDMYKSTYDTDDDGIVDNSELLQGQNSSYHLSRANHTGTQSADTIIDGTTNKVYTATEQSKLAGIATGATANDTDANLRARASHTGTQTASTISDFDSSVDVRIASGNSATTNALKSATTTVNVSSATAPTTGQVLTATSSTTATWQTPSGSSDKSCKVYTSVDIGITPSTQHAIAFDTEVFDTDTMHNNVTNNTRITATTAGKYAFVGAISLRTTNYSGAYYVYARKNGSGDEFRTRHQTYFNATGFTFEFAVPISFVSNLSAGDYIEIVVYVSNGSQSITVLGADSANESGLSAYKIA